MVLGLVLQLRCFALVFGGNFRVLFHRLCGKAQRTCGKQRDCRETNQGNEPAVARNPAGRYSACVRRLVFQRWAMTLLLLSRLVLGEFVHAMPVSHAPTEPEVVAAGNQNADCPQHEAAGGAGSESSDIKSSSDPHHDCCKSGACQCPCMHAPAALVASFVATSMHVDHGRIMTPANGFACDRLWLLFRPPA